MRRLPTLIAPEVEDVPVGVLQSGGGNLVLAIPSERVNTVLDLAGLTSLFSVFEDLTAAVGSF